MPIQAAIIAGGQGQRMRAVSDVPKVMLPVGGKPILEHQIEWLKKYGFSDVFLCLGYKADVVRSHFGDGSKWGVQLTYRIEETARGTAGAVADLAPSLLGDLLIVYGDLFLQMDCARLLAEHGRHDGLATLVVRRTEHPHDSDLVMADPEGRIRAIGRLRDGQVSGDLGCAAVWVVRRELLARVPADRPSDFGREIFPQAVADGEKLMAYRTEEPVLDIGTPVRYEAFCRAYDLQ
ncbi:MAG: sugar phosphate nucleotidyltransferase [Elusimicrobiota bacterium]